MYINNNKILSFWFLREKEGNHMIISPGKDNIKNLNVSIFLTSVQSRIQIMSSDTKSGYYIMMMMIIILLLWGKKIEEELSYSSLKIKPNYN
jgi:hypothetical protein